MEKIRFYAIAGVLTLFLTAFAVITSGNAEEAMASRDEYVFCTFTGRNLNSYNRPGDVDSFYVRVQNAYDGHLWRETHYESTSYNLYYARLGINHLNVLDESREMTYDILEESSTGSLVPDNGPKGMGFNITNSGSLNYYNDQGVLRELSFSVKRMNVKAGTYNLPVTLSFTVRTALDSTSSDGFAYSGPISMKGYITLVIESNIIGVSGAPKQLAGMEESSIIPIYSGARDIVLHYGYVHSLSTVDLEGFGFLLEGIPSEVTLPGTIRTLGTLEYSSKKVSWKMDVNDDAPAREYSMNLFFEYKKDEIDHREGPYQVLFTIAPTPLIVPKYGENDLAPMVQVVQGVGASSFGLTIINQGNVIIETGKVVLDLDSAQHLSTNSFYFDEGAYSNRVYPPLELQIEELGPGEELDGTFPPITIDDTLPPGDYYVPLDYQCHYRDPTEDPAVAMLVSSYQMDEIYEEDFMEIVYFRNSPRDPYQRGPHIILRVLEDNKGTDIRASVGPVLKAGSVQSELIYRFVNMEQYPLRSASISIRSGDPSSLYSSYNMSGDPFLVEMSGLQVPGTDIDGPGTLEISVLVNVPLNASTYTVGTHVHLTGRDIMNKLVVKDITLPVAITPYFPEPDIKVISILTTKVEPGREFTLTLQVMNAGDGYMSDLDLVLLSNSSKVSINDPSMACPDLSSGAIETVVYDCVADRSMRGGESCCLYLMAQYKDATGQVRSYSDEEPVPIMVTSLPPKDKEERTDGLVYIMIGLIVSTAFLSLAIFGSVLLVMLLKRSIRKADRSDQGDKGTGNASEKVSKVEASSGPSSNEVAPVPTPPDLPTVWPQTEPLLPPVNTGSKKPFSGLDDLFNTSS